MRVVVKKWGNSASVRIPAAIMQAAKLELDQTVDVREDGGRVVIEPIRPLVLSPAPYNRKAGLLLCCPMTTRIKGYPFECAVGGSPPGVVLADQIRCIDWRAR